MTLPRRRSGWIRGLFANPQSARSDSPNPRPRLRLEPLEDRAVPADLSVAITDSPDPVVAGENITYTLALNNAGPDDATGVSLTDVVPVGTTFVSATQTAGPAFTLTTPAVGGTGTVTGVTATLANGATATFEVVVNVGEGTAGGTTITNTATANAANETAPANNTDTETTAVNARADLSVAKTDTPDPVVAGQNLTYTLTLSNAGPLDANTVSLTDVLPVGTTFVSATQTAGPAFALTTPPVGGTGTVTGTAAAVPAGATATFELVVTVNATAVGGTTISNTASVTSTSSDPNLANNTDTETTTVTAAADLSVVVTDDPDPVTAGGELTYTLTVANAGPSDAAAVTLTDALPANTTFVSAAQASGPAFTLTTPAAGGTGTVTATRASFASGATATFTLVVTVNPTTLQGATVTNTATVAGTTTDPTPANNTDTETTAVDAQVDLSVTKADTPDPVTAGSDLTYTITVSNAGPSAAQAVSLTDLVPANTTFVSFAAPTGFVTTTPPAGGTGAVTAIAATLAPGTAVFTLVVNVNPGTPGGATVTNTATVATTTTETTLMNNTAIEATDVEAAADLSVTKTDAADPVAQGDAITYTITVANLGPSDAQGVTLTDAIPVGTTFGSVAQSSGPLFVIALPPGPTGTLTATAATFASGATATFVLVVNPNPALPGGTLISNTATVAATTADPDPSNNADTETTLIATPVDLTVTKTDGQDDAAPGSTVTYTVVVTNAGANDVTGASLTDSFPAELTDVTFTSTAAGGATGNTESGTGDLDETLDLPTGASVTYVITGTIASAATGMLANTATVTAPAGTLDTNPDDNTATDTNTLTPQADLAVTKTADATSVTAGSEITYTITLTNAGPSDAAAVSLTDVVPAGATFVSFTAPAGFDTTTPVVGDVGTITATSPTFASGATATFILVVSVNTNSAGTSIANTATVASDTTDPDSSNNTDTATTTVVGSADVGVTKVRVPGDVTPGADVTYTITVSNAGPSNAAGVTLTDVIPANATFVSATQASGPAFTLTRPTVGGTGTFTATGGLASGATAVFTLVVRVNGGTGGATLSNTAAVAATTPDPVAGNNSATNATTVTAPSSAVGRNVIAGGPTNGTAQVLAPNAAGALSPSGAPVTPFSGFAGNIRGATADVDGDGVADNIFVTGPGGPALFTVISGADGSVLVPATDPFGSGFTGGAFVAAGDFDGDGRADIVITPDQGGGPNVVLYELNANGSLAPARAFFALGNPGFRGGARVAVGDINGDGVPDLVVGAGFLGGPNVEIHDGAAVGQGDFVTLIGGGFFAFDGPDAQTLRDGVFVAVGDINGDGFGDAIFGGGPGGGPRVLVLSGNLLTNNGIASAQSAPLANFFAGDPASRPGVRVASKDLDGDGRDDLVLGSGQNLPARVRAILGKNITPGQEPTTFQDLDVFGGQVLPGGVFVG